MRILNTLGVGLGFFVLVSNTPKAMASFDTISASKQRKQQTAGKSKQAPVLMHWAPEPVAIRSQTQWVVNLSYRKGKATVKSWRKVRLSKPQTTVRSMGRFAVELLSGTQVVERVRFNFPLVGAEPYAIERPGYFAPPPLEQNVTVSYQLMVPDTAKASRLRLVDRNTGQSFIIKWPPRGCDNGQTCLMDRSKT